MNSLSVFTSLSLDDGVFLYIMSSFVFIAGIRILNKEEDNGKDRIKAAYSSRDF